ncbi:hypothetical protein BCR44DRAFT_1285350 [Catenaria anguillulae PL171]|uniref:Uncharacterized protein n=1 Tax=Catenaria anguillulae PL171 TaxID=765915 RepID=A0A1Y2HWM4_9FUNG|nr:hypothetical protein BCR44DRAFT_1285350 [Catenaria anguillulae PL171]
MKLLALIALLGSLALLANAYLVFHPTSLSLTSDLSGGVVQVRLAARPPRTVAVYFDAPKTRFDRCSLTFTPDNWQTPKTCASCLSPLRRWPSLRGMCRSRSKLTAKIATGPTMVRQ